MVVPMRIRISRFLAILLTSATLAGCAAAPEVSRSNVSVQAPRTGSISAHQRKFRAQARNVVYFGFNRDTLDTEARARLNEQAAWILENSELRFRVYGHTDKVGGDGYNYDLGLRRANRVVDYLVSKGVSRGRLEAMVSNGEESPAVNTEDRERLNRRVVTEVYGLYRAGRSVEPVDGRRTTSATGGTSTSGTPSGNDTTSTNGGDTGNSKSDKNPNSGRGNGDEAGDPGKSGGKNNGGDEV